MTNRIHRSTLYHGATVSEVRRLRELNAMEPGPVGRLGTGIYFWDGSDFAARQWAEEASRKHDEKPAIAQLLLTLRQDQWLDFTDPRVRADFHDVVRNWETILGEKNLEDLWEIVCEHGKVSQWGFWMNFWLEWHEKTTGSEILALRAIIDHQGFTFTEEVPRLEGVSVPSLKGRGLRNSKRAWNDNVNASADIDSNTRPRYPDAGIAWLVRDHSILSDIALI